MKLGGVPPSLICAYEEKTVAENRMVATHKNIMFYGSTGYNISCFATFVIYPFFGYDDPIVSFSSADFQGKALIL